MAKKINVQDVVSQVRNRYGKKEKGLAEDITTANNIILSEDESDYVVSDDVKFWKPLTGIIGLPFGRIVQIAGRPDSGKSTTAMLFMVAAQQAGHVVILWDTEKKFSSRRFKSMGGNPDDLFVSRSKLITEGAKQVSWFVQGIKEQDPDAKILIVWDSVGATLNSKEDDDTSDDYSQQPGVSAKEISWAIKRFNKIIERCRNAETGTETVALCCVNQVYSKIGFMAKGDQEKGGQELEFLSSIILHMRKKKSLIKVRNKETVRYGIITTAKVKKNHLFDGEDCVDSLELVISSDGINLLKDIKLKKGDNDDGDILEGDDE